MKKYIERVDKLIEKAKTKGNGIATFESGMIDEANDYQILTQLRSYYIEKGYKVRHTNDYTGIGNYIEIYCYK